MSCHHDVYMVISSCFVRPHLRYRKLKNQYYTEDHALDTKLLDMYLKDVFASFLLFWYAFPASIYKAHFKKEEKELRPHEVDDKYAQMLINYKLR